MGRLLKNSQSRFQKSIVQNQNLGHLLIDEGFKIYSKSHEVNTINLWDSKLGTSRCTCTSKNLSKEVLLATSIISTEAEIIEAEDFKEVETRLLHLMLHHRLKAVIGLGINGFLGNSLVPSKLSAIQQNFLNYLIMHEVRIGCRGLETLIFLKRFGFKESLLNITGCPSLQLLSDVKLELPIYFSRILVTGALINHLDLLDSKCTDDTKILFIPQTIGSYKNGLGVAKLDGRVEIFLPSSYKSWSKKLKAFSPQLSIGTRLHGNLLALSTGVPTIFISGDVRTREMTQTMGLPYLDSLVEISIALKSLKETPMSGLAQKKSKLSKEIYICLNN